MAEPYDKNNPTEIQQWKLRGKRMRKHLKLDTKTIVKITGLSPITVQRNFSLTETDLTRWLKLAIIIYERMRYSDYYKGIEDQMIYDDSHISPESIKVTPPSKLAPHFKELGLEPGQLAKTLAKPYESFYVVHTADKGRVLGEYATESQAIDHIAIVHLLTWDKPTLQDYYKDFAIIDSKLMNEAVLKLGNEQKKFYTYNTN